MALTSPSGDILDFHSRMFSLLRKRACMRMCSFRLYPASVLPDLKAPGAQYKQNPSFTMSISKTCAHESAQRITWVSRNLSGIATAKLFLGDGGDRRDRTDDLKLAKLPLYQLSYVPSSLSSQAKRDFPRRKPWWAWEELNFRPHAYQARALTN
jgi:hypothetical protein